MVSRCCCCCCSGDDDDDDPGGPPPKPSLTAEGFRRPGRGVSFVYSSNSIWRWLRSAHVYEETPANNFSLQIPQWMSILRGSVFIPTVSSVTLRLFLSASGRVTAATCSMASRIPFMPAMRSSERPVQLSRRWGTMSFASTLSQPLIDSDSRPLILPKFFSTPSVDRPVQESRLQRVRRRHVDIDSRASSEIFSQAARSSDSIRAQCRAMARTVESWTPLHCRRTMLSTEPPLRLTAASTSELEIFLSTVKSSEGHGTTVKECLLHSWQTRSLRIFDFWSE
mmetsp:Transcript_17005/g.32280  ORF Transcript_17005/g.32280 Transcript_17005/m.32280 type:complete len:281 (+) Transcript_17005:353-1195(+)